jgi:signal transduction histidine kinase
MNSKTISLNDFAEVVIYSSIGFVLMVLVLVLFFYFSRKKIIQYEIDKRDLIINHQKQMLLAVINTQEIERKRISQDLHDDISSNLNIVSLNSHLLTQANLNEKEISEITSNIINLTKKSLDNSRRIAHDLYPPVLEKFGLHPGIKELCLDFSTTKSVKINYDNHINFDSIPIENQLQIFRILQELISNSIRHGKAKNINIVFSESATEKQCQYTDDGLGFDVENAENKKGLGMKNIECRVSFLSGSIKFESEIKKGVHVLFTF